MNGTGLDFEKPILELERRIKELKNFSAEKNIDVSEEIKKLEKRAEKIKKEIFSSLTPWQRVQIARHPKRPYTMDYVSSMINEFRELHGDRQFNDDMAIVGGLGRLGENSVMIIGQQKGRETKENLIRNFGMPHPEGYRKVQRLFRMAEKFRIPVICFVDTPGAYPGIGAEERGQAHVIAENQMIMSRLKVPIIVVIIGEGGSGGALGIGVGNVVLMLENAYYSVISPEGCAAILWKDRKKAPEAAEALKLVSQDLLKIGIVDIIIPEPLGGAHRDPQKMCQRLKQALLVELEKLTNIPSEKLVENRYNRFRKFGVFTEPEVAVPNPANVQKKSRERGKGSKPHRRREGSSVE